MKTYNYSDLSTAELAKLVQRNVDPANEIRTIVEDVIAHVNEHGDSALFDYALKFDKVELNKLYLVKEELEENPALEVSEEGGDEYEEHADEFKTAEEEEYDGSEEDYDNIDISDY